MDRFTRHDLELANAELGLLRFVVDRMPAMIAYWGDDQRCRFANRAYEKWFGVDPEALVGRTLENLLGPIYPLNLQYIEGALRGEEQVFERDIPDPAGGPPRQSEAHYLPDVVDGEVRGFCVLVVDITRRKSAEAAVAALGRKLELVERLSALGTLAAGVGHEINNPLAIVMANLELALDRVRVRARVAKKARSPEVDALETALHGATRVRDVVRSMTLLAPCEESSSASVDVVACLESAIVASANVLRYRGRLVCSFRPVGKVVADSGQLTQVFVNLLMNAAHALHDERTALNEIRVSTRSEGSETVIEIQDNGEGIPESLLGRIFDPFFTTKEVGAGMGLGLSVSHGTIRALGGSLTVESRVGEGSRFFVRLPSWQAEPTSPGHPPPRAPTPPRAPQGVGKRRHLTERRLSVLLVDHDPVLGEALRQLLAEWCDVTLVEGGRKAIETLALGARHDLVLCELMMPHVSGMDVFDVTTQARPELANRFVFITGGAFTPRSRAFVRSVRVPVLTKPFEMDTLRDIVEAYAEMIGAGGVAPSG